MPPAEQHQRTRACCAGRRKAELEGRGVEGQVEVHRRRPVLVDDTLDPHDHMFAGADGERWKRVLSRFLDERRQHRRRSLGERWKQRAHEHVGVRRSASTSIWSLRSLPPQRRRPVQAAEAEARIPSTAPPGAAAARRRRRPSWRWRQQHASSRWARRRTPRGPHDDAACLGSPASTRSGPGDRDHGTDRSLPFRRLLASRRAHGRRARSARLAGRAGGCTGEAQPPGSRRTSRRL